MKFLAPLFSSLLFSGALMANVSSYDLFDKAYDKLEENPYQASCLEYKQLKLERTEGLPMVKATLKNALIGTCEKAIAEEEVSFEVIPSQDSCGVNAYFGEYSDAQTMLPVFVSIADHSTQTCGDSVPAQVLMQLQGGSTPEGKIYYSTKKTR